MLVKRKRQEHHLDDLWETFETLRLYNIKLNPNKCVIGVLLGMYFGFMVSQQGIEVNLDKIRAILEMVPQKSIKEV